MRRIIAGEYSARNRVAAGGSTDPYFSSVNLLLHCDGTNGSTSFPDSTGKNTVTPSSATVSTASPLFGTGAASITGSGTSSLTIPASTNFQFGSGDFTVELAFNRQGNSSGTYARLYWDNNGDGFAGLGIALNATGTEQDTLTLAVSLTGTSWALLQDGVGTLSAGYNRIAVTRSGTTFRVFVNGVQTYSTTISGSLYAGAGGVVIGGQTAGATRSVNGYIDEVRVTKGVARYTANYTPDSAAFPDS